MKASVILRTYNYRLEANTARSLLDVNGIESFLASDDAGAQYPGLGFTRGVRLLVDAENLERAKEVLATGDPNCAKRPLKKKPSKKKPSKKAAKKQR